MTNVAIRIDNLTRDFKSVHALDGLSIDIPEGTIFGFLVPNVAGNTGYPGNQLSGLKDLFLLDGNSGCCQGYCGYDKREQHGAQGWEIIRPFQ